MNIKQPAILFVLLVLTVLAWNLHGVARSQPRTPSASRFEYLRVTPYLSRPMNPVQVAYRACVAATSEWTCRDFDSKENSNAPLRTALATLGQEGWELVSAVDETPSESIPEGLTYLFKRHLN
jgi:hypothetical protein